MRGLAEPALPAGPHDQQHERCGERRVGPHQHGGEQGAERPHEDRVGRIALHVVHLRDQHDRGAVDGDAAEHGGVREGVELALEQVGGAAVAAPQRGEQQGEPGELRHGRPVGGNEAHDGEAEQHGAEDGEDRAPRRTPICGIAGRRGWRRRPPRSPIPRVASAPDRARPYAIPGHGASPCSRPQRAAGGFVISVHLSRRFGPAKPARPVPCETDAFTIADL